MGQRSSGTGDASAHREYCPVGHGSDRHELVRHRPCIGKALYRVRIQRFRQPRTERRELFGQAVQVRRATEVAASQDPAYKMASQINIALTPRAGELYGTLLRQVGSAFCDEYEANGLVGRRIFWTRDRRLESAAGTHLRVVTFVTTP